MNDPIVYWGKDAYSGWDKKPFSELKAGNVVMDNEFNTIVVAEDAHLSGDASYDGYLFYDYKGDSWFPESFDNRKITTIGELVSFANDICVKAFDNEIWAPISNGFMLTCFPYFENFIKALNADLKDIGIIVSTTSHDNQVKFSVKQVKSYASFVPLFKTGLPFVLKLKKKKNSNKEPAAYRVALESDSMNFSKAKDESLVSCIKNMAAEGWTKELNRWLKETVDYMDAAIRMEQHNIGSLEDLQATYMAFQRFSVLTNQLRTFGSSYLEVSDNLSDGKRCEDLHIPHKLVPSALFNTYVELTHNKEVWDALPSSTKTIMHNIADTAKSVNITNYQPLGECFVATTMTKDFFDERFWAIKDAFPAEKTSIKLTYEISSNDDFYVKSLFSMPHTPERQGYFKQIQPSDLAKGLYRGPGRWIALNTEPIPVIRYGTFTTPDELIGTLYSSEMEDSVVIIKVD